MWKDLNEIADKHPVTTVRNTAQRLLNEIRQPGGETMIQTAALFFSDQNAVKPFTIPDDEWRTLETHYHVAPRTTKGLKVGKEYLVNNTVICRCTQDCPFSITVIY